jgi:hypothetical protein
MVAAGITASAFATGRISATVAPAANATGAIGKRARVRAFRAGGRKPPAFSFEAAAPRQQSMVVGELLPSKPLAILVSSKPLAILGDLA